MTVITTIRLTRVVACVLLATQAACATTRVLQPTARDLGAIGANKVVVNQKDGRQVTVYLAHMQSDTLVGTGLDGYETTVPLRDIRSVSVRQISAGRTAGFIAAVLVVTAIGVKNLKGTGPGHITTLDCDKHPELCLP